MAKITALSEEEFVRRYADTLDGGAREARRAYRAAANMQEKATLLWANIKDAVAPHFSQTLFNNLPADFLDQQMSIPGYDRLFGSLDFIECDHCRSIFGPAAYFVDLMRFVERYIARSERNPDIPETVRLDYHRAGRGGWRHLPQPPARRCESVLLARPRRGQAGVLPRGAPGRRPTPQERRAQPRHDCLDGPA
jgi:hypothetical protein